MTLTALREGALASTPTGATVRLGLPWIRSLPLASLRGLEVTIDGRPVETIRLELGGRLVDPSALADELGWWFVQDRLVSHVDRMLEPGGHDVSVAFTLMIPYLQAGPDRPLTLPFVAERRLVLDLESAAPSVARDVA
ncbi:hypothetical protein GCM10009819_07000 [Agromyces tropicus]|uniref:Uncharacterized protein n=1 Tax=Agromyces tropicus TaxID=555371 RepID=A0ABN2U173_9MICO